MFPYDLISSKTEGLTRMVDIAVVVAVLVATTGFAALLRHRGVCGRRFGEAAWTAFFGLFLVISMSAHCVDVLSRLAIGTTYAGEPILYNFRVYSLFLLGGVLIALGLRIVRQAWRLAGWDPAARLNALRATFLVVAVTAPLLPIHAFFALIVTTVALVSLLVLSLARDEAPIPRQLPV